MKAIHNAEMKKIEQAQTVFNISKIQNESNSQQGFDIFTFTFDCVQYFKDTK